MSKEAHGTRSTTNESDKFYKVLLSLKSVGSEILTKSFINDKILNEYHGYEFLPKKITSSTSLLSMWVPWALKTTDNTKLREKLKALNEIYSKFYTNKKTLDVSFNRDIRNVIREKNGFKSPEHDLSLQLAAITKTEKTKMIKDAEEKVFEKNANQDTFESSQIYDIIRTNIKDPDPFKRMIALFIASGSRPIELFSKAMYRAIDDRWLEQKGVAKKKRGNSLDFSIIKPIIYINTHEFIDEIDNVRDEVAKILRPKTMSETEFDRLADIASEGGEQALAAHEKISGFLLKKGQLSSSVSSRLNQAAHKIFNNEDDFSAYFCRKLYGVISYEQVGKFPNIHGENMNLSSWLSSVLGHKESSLLTSHNYSHVRLDTPDDVTIKDLALHQQMILTKVKDLEEKLSKTPHIERAVPVIITNPRLIARNNKVKEIYDSNEGITQTKLEELCKGIPRAVVREWYKNNVI